MRSGELERCGSVPPGYRDPDRPGLGAVLDHDGTLRACTIAAPARLQRPAGAVLHPMLGPTCRGHAFAAQSARDRPRSAAASTGRFDHGRIPVSRSERLQLPATTADQASPILPTSSEKGGLCHTPTRSWFVEPTKAFNNADVDTLRRLFTDTTILHEPGHSPSPATSCATNCGTRGKRGRRLYARTRSPVPLIPTSPDARGPFLRSQRGA